MSKTTREHVRRSLYGEVEVVGRCQLREEEPVLDWIKSNALYHLNRQDVILTASGVTHGAEQLTVQLLKISAEIKKLITILNLMLCIYGRKIISILKNTRFSGKGHLSLHVMRIHKN